MASFRKRNSGQWQAQVRKKGYPTQTKSFVTRAAAAQWVRSIEYEMDQGLCLANSDRSRWLIRMNNQALRVLGPDSNSLLAGRH